MVRTNLADPSDCRHLGIHAAAEMLQEEIEVMGPVRSREVMQAQQSILAIARRMEAAGQIILKLEQGDSLMV